MRSAVEEGGVAAWRPGAQGVVAKQKTWDTFKNSSALQRVKWGVVDMRDGCPFPCVLPSFPAHTPLVPLHPPPPLSCHS